MLTARLWPLTSASNDTRFRQQVRGAGTSGLKLAFRSFVSSHHPAVMYVCERTEGGRSMEVGSRRWKQTLPRCHPCLMWHTMQSLRQRILIGCHVDALSSQTPSKGFSRKLHCYKQIKVEKITLPHALDRELKKASNNDRDILDKVSLKLISVGTPKATR